MFLMVIICHLTSMNKGLTKTEILSELLTKSVVLTFFEGSDGAVIYKISFSIFSSSS